ncbi:MAG: hypothetical protein O7B99_02500, partial [Planctomycetota bacterium]|nr:hypothetical protein [Planctomycetota bacterium]
MIRTRSSALLLALPLLAPALVAAPRADLEALVVEELANAPARTPGEIWERAMMLREAATIGTPGELDGVLDKQFEREELSPEARLLLAAARL